MKKIIAIFTLAALYQITPAHADPQPNIHKVLTSRPITKNINEYVYYGTIEFSPEPVIDTLSRIPSRSKSCVPQDILASVVRFRLISAGDKTFNFVMEKSLADLINPQKPVTITLYQARHFPLGNTDVQAATIEQANLKFPAYVPNGYEFQNYWPKMP